MRISTLSRGSAGLLLLASVGMACSVFWGLEKLKEPYRLNESYFGVVEQVSVKTRLLIDNYLRTGDAADLQKAQGFLAGEFKDSLSQLPSSLQTAIFPAINDLQQSMEVDLRSAGKLAGGIQSLLLQNEREQIASLDSLQDYVTEAEHSAFAELVAQYRAHISKLLHLIAKRSILRSSYFSAPSSQIKMSLEQISQDIESEAQTIQKLPLLGVKAEVEEDEFAALMGLDEAEDESSAESIDKGEEIGAEIAYLAGRYLPELERTASLVELGISAKIRVEELTRALEQRVKASKSYIDQERQNVEDLVITLLVGFLLLLFIVCVISAILQLRVLAGMSRVSSYISLLSDGDFSKPLDNEMYFKELHHLVECANRMQGYLCELVKEIRQEVGKVRQVSDSVDRFSKDIYSSTSQQRERTDEVNNAMSELVQSFRLVAGHAVEASGTAELGQQSVQHSAEVMDSLTGSIGDLAREASEGAGMVARLRDDSQNIESVLNVIISIADQTNLLALNAAIEAARAGDHGRGFAVVADEVRQLAQRTAESTQEIRQMIEGLQQSSDHVVTAMERQQRQAERSVEYASKAGESLHQVVDAISQISGMNTLIAQATEEQSCSADSVQESVADVQCQSQTAAQQATDVRRQSDDLSQVSLGLTRLVERYVI